MICMCMKIYWISEKGTREKCHLILFPVNLIEMWKSAKCIQAGTIRSVISIGFAVIVTAGVNPPIYLYGSEPSGQRSLHKPQMITRETLDLGK